MFNKKNVTYWTSSSLILIISIYFLDGSPEIDGWSLLGVFFAVILLVILSILLAVIIAAFSFKSNKPPSKELLNRYIPVLTIVITIVAIGAFVSTRPSYKKEIAANGQLCQIVRNGKFKLDNYLITRQGDTQTELDKITKQSFVYKVKWLSDCEFELTNTNDLNEITKIKILSVTKNMYECIVSINGRATKHKMDILLNGN